MLIWIRAALVSMEHKASLKPSLGASLGEDFWGSCHIFWHPSQGIWLFCENTVCASHPEDPWVGLLLTSNLPACVLSAVTKIIGSLKVRGQHLLPQLGVPGSPGMEGFVSREVNCILKGPSTFPGSKWTWKLRPIFWDAVFQLRRHVAFGLGQARLQTDKTTWSHVEWCHCHHQRL